MKNTRFVFGIWVLLLALMVGFYSCEKDVDLIVSGIYTNELAEQSCINLFEEIDFIDKKAFEWLQSEEEFTIVSGFILFSRIALPFISGNPSRMILNGSPAVCASMVFIFSQSSDAFQLERLLIEFLLIDDIFNYS